MVHKRPMHAPYTHQFRGLPEYGSLIRALQGLGFVLKYGKHFWWTKVGGFGTKNEGSHGAMVVFSNRAHADAIRLALSQLQMGDLKIFCERAEPMYQRVDDDREPFTAPSIEKIRDAVLTAYGITRGEQIEQSTQKERAAPAEREEEAQAADTDEEYEDGIEDEDEDEDEDEADDDDDDDDEEEDPASSAPG